MADITKCKGKGCPIKKTCYRFTATESEFRQAWLLGTPVEEIDGKFECAFYWETQKPKNA